MKEQILSIPQAKDSWIRGLIDLGVLIISVDGELHCAENTVGYGAGTCIVICQENGE